METDPDRTAEADLVALSEALTRPRTAECLFCFVDRMLNAFGCDQTLRWVRRWRELRLPRATGLERRLGRSGAFCDCEVFLNGWTVREDLLVPDSQGEQDWPPERPACPGVGPRSSQPCSTWEPLRRPW
ncbi:MAG: uncharacterized protein JWP68_2237 [Modestobacter sp.]|jgi:hypothetical protein|nr:uncharacterized protein [Modestobacter sp.]MCW2576224.1 uncharacterized protein [Modestobacter sp.]